jgi:DNA repair protein RecO (recombination protein O)
MPQEQANHGGRDVRMLYRVEGIVIRSMDYGEGNKIISLYTKQYGKVSVMARGVKKMKSRHSAITQLFTYGEFAYFKSGQMGTLNDGEIVRSHHRLREDLHMAAYAAYLAELVDRMTEENDGSAYLFEQLNAGLDAMEDGKDAQITAHIFEMKMLSFAGYSPVLAECVSCGGNAQDPVISVSMGGLLCTACRSRDTAAMVVSEGTLKLLSLFTQMDLRRLGAVNVKPNTKAELKRCMREWMDTHVDVRFKSRGFLDQMEKYDF